MTGPVPRSTDRAAGRAGGGAGGERPMAELAALLERACAAAERDGGPLVLWHRATARTWPGTADVADVAAWERVLRRVERVDVPVVAVVVGACSGPALETVLVADHRIAAVDARIGLPRERGRVWPGMVLHRLATHLGAARARSLAVRGTELTAAQALQVGLVDEVTDDPAAALASVIADAGALAGGFATRRALLLDAAGRDYAAALAAHLAACDAELSEVDLPARVVSRL
ncbi:enoyl-CoA-hydratase DpgB [Actinokineospora cianjurensis]|nr:enoyl-CoA-hydratase DpgB [Actinokineospora cianjurensis]